MATRSAAGVEDPTLTVERERVDEEVDFLLGSGRERLDRVVFGAQ